MNGTTGSSSARPRPATSRRGVRCGAADGAATAVATRAATGIDTARPFTPLTWSPTRWVSSTYAAQQAAAPSA
ncbi:hypothetical protein GCM10025868_25650 [Angustibacter aerolatus]|uniref:Uncharacterized protein n=1 Tax=Angustibacter aerolatus TaxID=1162965 RepID=A0ABQ6JGK7_9ACTN|nr:hypothetical protein GCM10025868_25650 [Angustibacter aerolatus]